MLSSYIVDTLIEVWLVNGEQVPQYDNADYGIVDGVMYLTTGQTDFTFNSNFYKAGLVYNVGNITNNSNYLDMFGGYKPYNNWSFEIRDEGISNTLKALGINFYHSQVRAYSVIDTNTFDLYLGAVGKIGSTGNKIKITCEDIALVKESLTMNPTVLGSWDEAFTNRDLQLSGAKISLNATYQNIFPGLAGDPNDNTQDSYDDDNKMYQTLVVSTDEVSGVFGIFYYVTIYVELAARIAINPNYGNYDAYVSSLFFGNIEVLDADDNTINILHLLNPEIIVTDGELKLRVDKDASFLEDNKSRIRIAHGNAQIRISESPVEGDLNINGFSQYTSLLGLFLSDLNTVTMNNGSFSDPGLMHPMSSDGGLFISTIIPSTNSIGSPDNLKLESLQVNNASFAVGLHKTNFAASEFDFTSRGQTVGTLLASVSFASSPAVNNGGSIFLKFKFPKKYLKDDDWKIGFSIHSNNTSVTPGLSFGIAGPGVGGGGVGVFGSYSVTTETVIGSPFRVIEINSFADAFRFGKNVFVSSDYSVMGAGFATNPTSSPQPLESMPSIYNFTSDQIDFTISANDFSDDFATVNINFHMQADGATGLATADLYLNSFYMYKDELTPIRSLEMFEGKGEKWSNDPKYTGGASSTFPLTRTEMARYILDTVGFYDETTYQNDIFLPLSDDIDPMAYDNYGNLNKTCVELIDDVLQSSNFILTGNILGNRKMINLYDIVLAPAVTTKTFTGSMGRVTINGFYDNVVNQYIVDFDGSAKISALFDKNAIEYVVISNVKTVESSDDSLINNLTVSAVYSGADGKVKSLTHPYSSYGTPSNISAVIGEIADVHGWPVYKFTWVGDLKDHLTAPVYQGDWGTFRDLKFTNDLDIKALIQGVRINLNDRTVEYNCISAIIKPPVEILDEQLGGLGLNEQIGGRTLSE